MPRSAFQDLDTFAQHVAERLSLKTTTRTFGESLERTGGPGTMRVLNIEAQRHSATLRRAYDAEVVEPLQELQRRRLEEAREEYGRRKIAIAASNCPPEERLDARCAALSAFRKRAAAIYRKCKPQSFSAWLDDHTDSGRRAATSRHRIDDQEQRLEKKAREPALSRAPKRPISGTRD